MTKPLCIDLFCGLGGWTDGFLAEGYDVVGFDVERHEYGEQRYPAQLVLQDVRTIHGAQFKEAAVIVASSPCQAYSYMAMPWGRAKQIAAALRGQSAFPDGYKGSQTIAELNELFEQPARIQREACEAAGRYIPMIQENVKGAQQWVGPAAWHYGSFYLWGDVPALMPITLREPKQDRVVIQRDGHNIILPQVVNREGSKNAGGSWFNIGSPGQKVVNRNPVHDGTKVGGGWFHDAREHTLRRHNSKSLARKAASARIAKIPYPLARWIAHAYRPRSERAA
jgi:hypothetical protein